MPNPRLLGDTPKTPGVTAVPVTAKATFEFVAVETIARFPLSAPLVAGVKITWKDAL